MTEMFDVVDVNDRVIDVQPRHIVHQRGLLHRSVHALVFNDRGELYLQKRAMSKDTNPGLWDTSVGGHVDQGEDYDQALLRETEEELGIQLAQVPQRMFKLDACEQTGQEFIWVYKISYSGEIEPCPVEIIQGRWFNVEQLRSLIYQSPALFTSSLLLIINKFGLLPDSPKTTC